MIRYLGRDAGDPDARSVDELALTNASFADAFEDSNSSIGPAIDAARSRF